MGNSGYSLFHVDEKGKMHKYHHSEAQNTSFNKPLQISSQDCGPIKGYSQTHKVRENDIIMLYSEGFSDNVFKTDFATCLEPYINSEGSLQNFSGAAVCSAVSAYELSKQKIYKSPFGVDAGKAGPKFKNLEFGGRQDDISVVIAQFHKDKTSRDRLTIDSEL
jgi:hypothetical protein